MGTEAVQTRITGISSVDLSAKQFYFVKCAATTDKYGTDVTTIAAATDTPLGIVQDAQKAGDEVAICIAGVSKCVVGAGGIVAGDLLTIDSGGKVITAPPSTLSDVSSAIDTTSGTDIGDWIVGIALYTHAASDVGTILLRFAGRVL